MAKIVFHLNISAQEYLKYYQGTAQQVQVRSVDGRRVRFPANLLKNHVSHQGVHGLFQLEYSENNKLVSFIRLDRHSS